MSAALERLKQHDTQQRLPAIPVETEVLTSLLAAVQAQNHRLATMADQQAKLASYIKVMDQETGKQIEGTERRLQSLITLGSVPTPSDSSMSENVRNELHEIGLTLSSLASALDVKRLDASVSLLTTATNRIERTTAWNSERAAEFVTKYEAALNFAGRAINTTRDQAVEAINTSASTVADTATEEIALAVEHVRTATESAQHLVKVAEHLQTPLGWAAAARMALTLLPVTVTLLMAVQTVWALVVGVRWVVAQNWALWLSITAGIVFAGLVAGAGFGLWRVIVRVRVALDDAANRHGWSRR